MKKSCLLVAINAKYIHSSLAVRYLKSYCQHSYTDIRLQEHSINDHFDNMLKQIYNSNCDIYAFSCYIWNIDLVLKLCSSLKKVKPDAIIVLGGPEISYDSESLINKYSFIDYIIKGEGEETLLELLLYLNGKSESIESIAGLTYRTSSGAEANPCRKLLKNLEVIPFPYDDLEPLENKIIYYETSRGCPFNCQYCLSSTIHGVRFLPMDRVKQDLKFFINKGVKQVKLVDRTFNCNKKHSLEIIQYIMEQKSKTNFHFEIAADLLDDEIISVLAQAPKGMFQFEIGVQSTNIQTLKEIRRRTSIAKIKENVIKLKEAQNSHIHLDLIAGLPFEDFESFKKSFDEVHELMPDMLQLGFLKVLKGSGIRERAEEYYMQYNDFSPYEVLSTKWISYEEIIILKEIEQLLELYFNSGRFSHSLEYIFKEHYSSYFNFYENLSKYWKDNELFKASQSTRELYNILYRFAEQQGIMNIELNELIKLDWLMYYNNGTMPDSIKRYSHGEVKNDIQNYIKSSTEIAEALFGNGSIDSKSLLKSIYYEVFYTDILSNPGDLQEWIIFFGKDKDGNLQHYAKKLDEVINK